MSEKEIKKGETKGETKGMTLGGHYFKGIPQSCIQEDNDFIGEPLRNLSKICEENQTLKDFGSKMEEKKRHYEFELREENKSLIKDKEQLDTTVEILTDQLKSDQITIQKLQSKIESLDSTIKTLVGVVDNLTREED